MARRRRKKLPADPITVSIESLSHEGRGISHIDGKTLFVDGALPGETVTARFTRKRGRFDEARTVDVIEAADNRTTPHCPHFGVCGGCSLQHMQHEQQIAHKQAVMLEQMQHIGGVTPEEILPPLTGPLWGYRRKARLGVKLVPKKGGVLVGFRERGQPYITDMNICPILHPLVGNRINELRELIGTLTARDRIPQIEVAIDDEQAVLIFRHLDELNDADKEILTSYAKQTGIAIYLQPGGPDSIHPLEPADGVQLQYGLDDFDITIKFRADDFTQVNSGINRSMLARAIEFLQPNEEDSILDLFCGLGNFTLPIARQAGLVIGVEGDAGLVERARANARFNLIDNVSYESVNLMAEPIQGDFMHKAYNKMLLDPPRSGAIEILQQLELSTIQRIVYISCNPATLARDTGYLVQEKGFKLLQAGIMDMFPHTSHVESMAVFEKK